MQFIDEVHIFVKAGDGGNGCVSFGREKFFSSGKPDGGDGGIGGNIFIISNRNINTLKYFVFKKYFLAQSGKNGCGKNCRGKNGKDLILRVPQGTRIINIQTNEIIKDLIYHNQIFLLAKGGYRGFGNARFKSSKNRSPKNKTFGEKCSFIELKLELLLLADVGIIGLPNSGKSSLLNSMSNANPKVKDYPFTTLEPQLGVMFFSKKKKIVLADIPGLIKGASIGSGLGIRFLKHIERCKILLHLVDLFSFSLEQIVKNIRILMKELYLYNYNILKKDIWLVFNKIDLLKKNIVIKNIKFIIKSLGLFKKYYIISALKNIGVKKIIYDLVLYFN